ncbi:MAG: DedA family protein [Patescibacteria group bacterium]|nr:DedA family protein [Patescibacteria group bacterium]
MIALNNVTDLLIEYKYLILFPITVVEGPIITIIAGFMASLGYLSAPLVFAVAVAGDLSGDCLYYAIGRWGRVGFINRWGKYIGLNEGRIEHLEKYFKDHSGKTLAVGKLLHGIGTIFLSAAGAAEMPFFKFFWINFLATLPKSFILMIIGFYFGQAATRINSIFEWVALITFGVGILVAIIYFLYFRKTDPEAEILKSEKNSN